MKLFWSVLTVLLLAVVAGVIWWQWQSHHDHAFDGAITSAARRYGVDPALVKAVVWRESWFNPEARGKAGEIGLMQLRGPAAGEWAKAEKIRGFETEQLVDPRTNTLAGTWYLQKMLRRYARTDNPPAYALADYNAGRTHVLRWIEGSAATNSQEFLQHITFPATRHYVETVLERREHYSRSMKATPP